MRRIEVIGNLTKDAEIKNVSGKNLITFTVAVNEKYKDKTGTQVDKAHYFDCSLWRDETHVANYLKKGLKIWTDGTPELNIYEGADGKAKGGIRIRVERFEFLSSVKSTSESQNNNQRTSNSSSSNSDDDLPF